ncbi:MAG TPA: thioredoxin family protein [Bacillota bacterium]|nr:thioredoxin family protein [Bacillota bacterium]
MALFGKKKEKCCCNDVTADAIKSAQETKNTGSTVKVLGGGCAKCHALEVSVRSALEKLGMNTDIELVTDYAKIASYGVMSTPALVINGKVVSYGKVLSEAEAEKIILSSNG